MSEIDVYEVVKKLIGEIEPVGEAHTDEKRLANIKQMTALADAILHDLHQVRRNKDRHEGSMRLIGRHAHGFFWHINSEYMQEQP